MKTLKVMGLLFTMFVFGLATAQEQTGTALDFEPLGDIRVGEYQPHTGAGGAIIFSGTTPGDQHPDIILVGPNEYWERFEIDDDAGVTTIWEGLTPGPYSVASTDDGLQVVHAVVDVRAGEAVAVHVNLEPMDQRVYAPGAYTPAYPATAYPYGPYTAYPSERFGTFNVQAPNEDVLYVVTGPNDYVADFRGSFSIGGLTPGVYVIAGTAEGRHVSAGRLEVRLAERVPVTPVELIVIDEVTGAVTPPAQQQTQQQEQQTQQQEQQLGSLAVTVHPEEATVNITGPDDYTSAFNGAQTLSRLHPGEYVVAVTHDGYQPSRQTVDVTEGEQTNVEVTLQRQEQ